MFRKFLRKTTFWRTHLEPGAVVLTIEHPKDKPLAHIKFTEPEQIDPLIESLISLRCRTWGAPEE